MKNNPYYFDAVHVATKYYPRAVALHEKLIDTDNPLLTHVGEKLVVVYYGHFANGELNMEDRRISAGKVAKKRKHNIVLEGLEAIPYRAIAFAWRIQEHQPTLFGDSPGENLAKP